MITEKAIHDAVWCPVLFTEEGGKSKRVKADRQYPDTLLNEIKQTLMTKESTRKALFEQVGNELVARPYERDFWVTVFAGESYLLITFQEARIRSGPKGYEAVLFRKQKYPLRTDSHKQAESYLAACLLRKWSECFPQAVSRVITSYPDGTTLEADDSEDNLSKADDFFEELHDMGNGIKPLYPEHSRCSECWWRACPSRVLPSPIKPIDGISGMCFL